MMTNVDGSTKLPSPLTVFVVLPLIPLKKITGMEKDNHMRAISKQQNIQFTDIIFFDDQYENIESTKKMGISAVHCRE